MDNVIDFFNEVQKSKIFLIRVCLENEVEIQSHYNYNREIIMKILLTGYISIIIIWQLILLHSFTNNINNMESWTIIRLFNISITWIISIFVLGTMKELCVVISITTVMLICVAFCDHPDSLLSIWRNRNTFMFHN